MVTNPNRVTRGVPKGGQVDKKNTPEADVPLRGTGTNQSLAPADTSDIHHVLDGKISLGERGYSVAGNVVAVTGPPKHSPKDKPTADVKEVLLRNGFVARQHSPYALKVYDGRAEARRVAQQEASLELLKAKAALDHAQKTEAAFAEAHKAFENADVTAPRKFGDAWNDAHDAVRDAEDRIHEGEMAVQYAHYTPEQQREIDNHNPWTD